jgi:hypothetical protein
MFGNKDDSTDISGFNYILQQDMCRLVLNAPSLELALADTGKG